MTKLVFRSGYYHDDVAFANALNHQITKILAECDYLTPLVRFSFDPASLKMSLMNNSRNMVLFTTNFLWYLGFSRLVNLNQKAPMVASQAFDIHRGRMSIAMLLLTLSLAISKLHFGVYVTLAVRTVKW